MKNLIKIVSVLVTTLVVSSCGQNGGGGGSSDNNSAPVIEKVYWDIESIDQSYFTKKGWTAKNSIFVNFWIYANDPEGVSDIKTVRVEDEYGYYWDITNYYESEAKYFGGRLRFYDYANSNKIDLSNYKVVIVDSSNNKTTQSLNLFTPGTLESGEFVYSEEYNGDKQSGVSSLQKSAVSGAYLEDNKIHIHFLNEDSRIFTGYIWFYDQNSNYIGVTDVFNAVDFVSSQGEQNAVAIDDSLIHLDIGKGLSDINGFHIVAEDGQQFESGSGWYHRSISRYVTLSTKTQLNEMTDNGLVENGIHYFLSRNPLSIIRWDTNTRKYLPSLTIGKSSNFTAKASTFAISGEDKRIYVGYENGDVKSIDLNGDLIEEDFTVTSCSASKLAIAGDFVFVQNDCQSSVSDCVFNKQGQLKDEKNQGIKIANYSWDNINKRLYYLSDQAENSKLFYIEINPANGLIDSRGEFNGPDTHKCSEEITISPDGSSIILGNGEIYNTKNLEQTNSFSNGLSTAFWSPEGLLISLRPHNNRTLLERRNPEYNIIDTATFEGKPHKVISFENQYEVITIVNGQLTSANYQPNDDFDNDGIHYPADKFPLDIAASVDTDNDGYPDSWNLGFNSGDTTTGLSLDIYPTNEYCNSNIQRNELLCSRIDSIPSNSLSTIRNDNNDIIYLLDSESNQLRRWSAKEKELMLTIDLGSLDSISFSNPNTLEFSPSHQRLYIGYDNGAITYIDISGDTNEKPFASLTHSVERLASTGNYILAQSDRLDYFTHYILDQSGNITDSKWNSGNSEVYEWNSFDNRVYFYSELKSPNNINYEQISQETGQILSSAGSQYHGVFPFLPPIKVSPDGQKLFTGSGHFFKTVDLNWSNTVPGNYIHAVWNSDGNLLSIRNDNNSILERRNADLIIEESYSIAGEVKGMFKSSDSFIVITELDSKLHFLSYVPQADTDQDGTTNQNDKFPFDPSASVDTDDDGYPDYWNSGYSTLDSTSRLIIDQYPLDLACYLAEHGNGIKCDVTLTIPDYTPDKVVIDKRGILYSLSSENRRIYRYSSFNKEHISPIRVGFLNIYNTSTPVFMEYSDTLDRLYLGYSGGVITFIDLSNNEFDEKLFTTLPASIGVIADIENYLLAQDDLCCSPLLFVLDSSGDIVYYEDSSDLSYHYVWNKHNNRIYQFRDSSSPNDVLFKEFNLTNGSITSDLESPYHGEYRIKGPITISPDGSKVLLGSGDIYNAQDLTWTSGIGKTFSIAEWSSIHGLITIKDSNNYKVLERHNENYAVIETRVFEGSIYGIFNNGEFYTIATRHNSKVEYTSYYPSDDSDEDGVENISDMFPVDPAASIDTDNDGYPDQWNAGNTIDDSTTGLVLDSYPGNSACYLPEHGDGSICDIEKTIPDYSPKTVLSDNNGIIYLLSTNNNKVFRYSSGQKRYLDPLVVGSNNQYSDISPVTMSFSSIHNRLYLGYTEGKITYIDLSSSSNAEVDFSNISTSVSALANAGEFLHAKDDKLYYDDGFYLIDSQGQITDSKDCYCNNTAHFHWDNQKNRMYFFDQFGPGNGNALRFNDINTISGQFISSGTAIGPFHFDRSVHPPMIFSHDRSKVVVGYGDIHQVEPVDLISSLNKTLFDGIWSSSNELVTLRKWWQTSILENYNSEMSLVETQTYPGIALALFHDGSHYTVVTQNDSNVMFHSYYPNIGNLVGENQMVETNEQAGFNVQAKQLNQFQKAFSSKYSKTDINLEKRLQRSTIETMPQQLEKTTDYSRN